ncbi:MAG: hypothetical protein IKR59_06570, partial [Lachnospiraceae bacterium]|nr:hypothetical protein [Lachnospiraceae bacterium]
MKRDDLLDAVGGIDSEIIEESRKLRQNKKPYRNRLAVILPIAAAALLAVGVISAVLWNSMHGNTGAEVTDPGNPVETVTLYENSHEMNEEERAALEAAEKAAETAEQAYQAYLAELKRQREEAAAAFAAAEAEEEAARQASEAEKQALEAARQAEKEASKRAEETAEEIHLTKISFDDTSDVILGIGQSIKARVTVTLKKELVYSRDDIRFISENPEIAVVSQVNSLYGEYYFYTIKALKEGETYVYASSKDGSITSEKVKVIVSPPVERIELSVTSDDLALGE